MDKFVSYENDLNVLNEGFFDFVKKLTGRLIHSMFKVKKYNELFGRLEKLEALIKYGKNKKMKATDTLSEMVNEADMTNVRRRLLVEDDDNSSSDDNNSSDDNSGSDDNSDEITVIKPTGDKKDEVKGVEKIKNDIKNKFTGDFDTQVDIDKVNVNIPSFPATVKQLLIGLQRELEQMKQTVNLENIKKDTEKIRSNKNTRLSADYIQALELYTTNFLRKYSKGGINIPKPANDAKLSKSEVAQWRNLMKDISGGKVNTDIEFKSIVDAMTTVVNTYKDEFKLILDEFEKKDDKAIDKYKDGDKSNNDIKFKAEQRRKILNKLDIVCQSCIDFIPTAIFTYFVNSKVYKECVEYVSAMLELLYAATDIKVSHSENVFVEILQLFNYDTVNIDEVNDIKNSINWPTTVKQNANTNNTNPAANNTNNASPTANIINNAKDELTNIASYKYAYNNFLNTKGFPAEFKNNKKSITINDIENNPKFNAVIDELSGRNDYKTIFAALLLLKYVDSNFTYKLSIVNGNDKFEINF